MSISLEAGIGDNAWDVVEGSGRRNAKLLGRVLASSNYPGRWKALVYGRRSESWFVQVGPYSEKLVEFLDQGCEAFSSKDEAMRAVLRHRRMQQAAGTPATGGVLDLACSDCDDALCRGRRYVSALGVCRAVR